MVDIITDDMKYFAEIERMYWLSNRQNTGDPNLYIYNRTPVQAFPEKVQRVEMQTINEKGNT
jgi:hypothetical protein